MYPVTEKFYISISDHLIYNHIIKQLTITGKYMSMLCIVFLAITASESGEHDSPNNKSDLLPFYFH